MNQGLINLTSEKGKGVGKHCMRKLGFLFMAVANNSGQELDEAMTVGVI